MFQLSGGTTGRPKVIQRTHALRPRGQGRVSAHEVALAIDGDDTVGCVVGTVVEQERLVDDRDRSTQVR